LKELGAETGYFIPLTFMSLPKETAPGQGEGPADYYAPLYPYALGLSIALLFGFVLGFGATFAEPALRGKLTWPLVDFLLILRM
jgi:hypothetical protein